MRELTTPPPTGRGGLAAALRRLVGAQLANPLFRNAYALMVNTGATAALGLAYWILATRYYSPADVGRGSAAIAAMKLLSGLTALTLTGSLTRFLPRAGRSTGRLIAGTYLLSSVVAAAVTVVFLATLVHWGPTLAWLGSPPAGLLFTGAVVAWCVFTLQDGVLTGLRSAVWVPIENAVFGVAKLVLLVALAASFPRDGLFASWIVPVAVSLVPVNLLIFGRLVPRHVQATGDRFERPTLRRFARFAAGDYTGALFVLAIVYLVPVVVAARFAPEVNAVFYIAWTVGGTIDLLAINMAMSLTVEGVFDQARLAANCAAALRRTFRILLPVTVALVLLAPQILAVFGSAYAEQGTLLLRLLALAALPRALIELYLGVLRAQGRASRLAAVQGALCALVLGSALALTGAAGVNGAGYAVLVSQVVVAVMILPGLRAALARGDRTQPGPAREEVTL